MKLELRADSVSKYRQELMGLSILGILVFHFFQDCRSGDYNYTDYARFYYDHIGSSCVDVFLFLSGLGLYYSLKKNGDIKRFYSRRFSKILIPYFLVAVPTFIYMDAVLEDSVSLMFKDLFFITFLKDGDILFWYILLMVICYLFTPHLFGYIDSAEDDHEVYGRMFALISFVLVCVLALQVNADDFFRRTNIMFLRIPAFIGGMVMGRLCYSKTKLGSGFIMISLLAIYLNYHVAISYIYTLRMVIALTAICAAVLIALISDILLSKLKLFSKIIFPVLRWVGKYTLELYICHVAVRRILNIKDIPTYRYRNELLMLGISILAVAIVRLLTLLINKSYDRKTSRNVEN